MITEDRLKELLGKYYEGETSPDEELELKEYFSGNDILPGYNAEQDIFRHYSCPQEIPAPSEGFELRIINAVDQAESRKIKAILRKRYITIFSAAATILIIAGTWFLFDREKEPADTFSDPRLAYYETMKVLNEVSVRLNNGKAALKKVNYLTDRVSKSIRSVDRSLSEFSVGLRKAGLNMSFDENEQYNELKYNN